MLVISRVAYANDCTSVEEMDKADNAASAIQDWQGVHSFTKITDSVMRIYLRRDISDYCRAVSQQLEVLPSTHAAICKRSRFRVMDD